MPTRRRSGVEELGMIVVPVRIRLVRPTCPEIFVQSRLKIRLSPPPASRASIGVTPAVDDQSSR
jgi:hypothetical protein